MLGSFQIFPYVPQMFAWLTKPPFVCMKNLQKLSLATDGCVFLMFSGSVWTYFCYLKALLSDSSWSDISANWSDFSHFASLPRREDVNQKEKFCVGLSCVAAVGLDSLKYSYMMMDVVHIVPLMNIVLCAQCPEDISKP